MRTIARVRLCGAAPATVSIFPQPLNFARAADRELTEIWSESVPGSCNGNPLATPEDKKPMHNVSVAEFSIDCDQVSNAQFARFLDAVGTESARREKYFDIDDDDARVHRRSGRWPADPGHEKRPGVEVSWFGALAFCNWLGKRLPREAEWERAAHGFNERKFPWGSERPDAAHAHFSAGWNDFRDVGSFPKGAAPDGVFDLAENGWEWVSNASTSCPYNGADDREDLSQPHVRIILGAGHDSPRRRVDHNSSRSTRLAQFSFGASRY